LRYIRNRKTEEKKSFGTAKPQKQFAQNRKPHTKPSKTDTMAISRAYRANYNSTNFIKVSEGVISDHPLAIALP